MIEGEHDQLIGGPNCKGCHPQNEVVVPDLDILFGRIDTTPPLHPATQQLLEYFAYDHLPEHLQWVSQPFHDLAHNLAHNMDLNGPELTVGLRKLMEAKDCAVRAAL